MGDKFKLIWVHADGHEEEITGLIREVNISHESNVATFGNKQVQGLETMHIEIRMEVPVKQNPDHTFSTILGQITE